jgi:putative RecB family exonuclease
MTAGEPAQRASEASAGPPDDAADGVVRIAQTLSPSRASDFQNCPLLYRFRTIDRLPQAPSAAAVRGTLVHSVLEGLFDLPAAQRSPEAAIALLPGAWVDLAAEDPAIPDVLGDVSEADWLAQAGELVRTYFEVEDPARLEPAEREAFVEAVVGDELTLRGYIDRLDVNAAGMTRVVDYKTGRSPREAFEGKALFQMRFYALVLWRRDGVIPSQLKLIYLADGRTLIDQPDAATLEATERKVLALWQTIRSAIVNRDFPPNTSRLCDWCDHQDICPAFGGTPPELPLLELIPYGSDKMDPVATMTTDHSAQFGLEEA